MISCNDVKQLLPGYLDGELSEAQAAPARAHLMDCCTCRELVQEGKVLSRWFHGGQGEPITVPKGFSARIARRAFAGDPGTLTSAAAELRPLPHPLMPFLLKLTAVAAVVLFVLSLQIKRQDLPESVNMEATDYLPPWVLQPETPAGEDVLGLPAGAQPAPALPAKTTETDEADEDARVLDELEQDGDAL